VFGCEKLVKKVGHQHQRIVQILLENYTDTSSNVCITLETRQVGLCLLQNRIQRPRW